MVFHECICVYDWSNRRWRGSSFVCSCVVGNGGHGVTIGEGGHGLKTSPSEVIIENNLKILTGKVEVEHE
jgi:hypothetical protein